MPQHSQHETFQPPLETLHKKPSVTIYLDGLLVCAYDKHQKRFQVGIHVEAHFHALTIKVKERGQSTYLESLCLEHNRIEEIAPFFLFVEKKEGSRTPNGAATLFKSDDPGYRQAFANVLDLQSKSFHKRDRLRIKPQKLAPLNILNGEFYSATLGRATRKNLKGNPNPLNLGFLSTRVAGDISSARGNLILRSKDTKAKPLIKLPLGDEKHYEVYILNEPADDHEMDADHAHDHSGDRASPNGQQRANHFNVYYEALVLRNDAMKFEVDIEEEPRSTSLDIGPTPLFLPDDPPCIVVQVSGIPQLPDFL
jgi:hypothetical protein